MPVIISDQLPARKILLEENVFVMDKERAEHQDIRPLQIALVNLMPTKIQTETQFIRMLSNTPIQIHVEFIYTKTHDAKNIPESHMKTFYKSIDEVSNQKFDAMIVTGAPVEMMEFEDVDYWEELKRIIDFAESNVTSTMYICWGAQAALHYLYGLPKYQLPAKMFGVFEHKSMVPHVMLLNGFDDLFYVPHSRHTEMRLEDIEKIQELIVLAKSDIAGAHIVATEDYKRIFIMGHSEYDPGTLKGEYDRDIASGVPINIPINYYPDDDPQKPPFVKWRGHGNLLFKNWINIVYQETPYLLEDIGKKLK